MEKDYLIIENQYLKVTIALKGAELRAINYQGIAFLHDGNPQYWNRVAPYLFPNVGALKNNQTVIDGQTYQLPKHGFLRDMQFKIHSLKQDEVDLYVTSDESTLKLYPFDFNIHVKYQLNEKQLLTQITIENQGQGKMPFNFGLHPGFRVPLFDGEHFTDYVIEFEQAETAVLPTVDLSNGLIDETIPYRYFTNLKTLQLNYDDYRNDALIFAKVSSQALTIKHYQKNHGIKFSFAPFPTIAIWTPSHAQAPLIALEPWIGQADAPQTNGDFRTKKDLITLNNNEVFVINYIIEPFIND